MNCENCGKNNATTHIKRVINGVVTEKHLCSVCAAEYGYSKFEQNGIANMLASMLGDFTHSEKISSAQKCGCCGASFYDIVETGKVGCPECYNEFYNQLLPYLKRLHGSVKHMGKVPNNAPLTVVKDDELTELRRRLELLVKEEKFETAAQVRDEIKMLEKGANGDE